jgi:hypothetical protein
MSIKIYISNQGTLAVKFAKSLYGKVRDVLTDQGWSKRYFDAGDSIIFYLPTLPLQHCNQLQTILVREVGVDVILDKPLRSFAQSQVKSALSVQPRQERKVSVSTQPPKKEESLYEYVINNHVKPPKELTYSQRQFQVLIRNQPKEATEFILTTEDEKCLEYTVFGDWAIEEVQTFDHDGWTLCMRGYGLPVPDIKELKDYVAYCLPRLYKAAREYKNSNAFAIFTKNLECLMAD